MLFRAKVLHHWRECGHSFKRLKMARNCFLKLNSRYRDVKRRAASSENLFRRTSYEIWCEPTVEPKKITSTMFFSLEYSEYSRVVLYKYRKYLTLVRRLLENFLHVNTRQIWQWNSACARVVSLDSKSASSGLLARWI